MTTTGHRLALIVSLGFCTASVFAEPQTRASHPTPHLEQVAPELNARLIGLEGAQGVLFGALIAGNGTVDEAAVFARMLQRVEAPSAPGRPDTEADAGYNALGPRTAAIIRRAQAFHRETLAIFASVPAGDRRSALDAALQRYRSDANLALAGLPKDMTLLYDHPYTSFIPPGPGETEPRRQLPYPKLTGFVWSSHWYQLAVQEPLERFDGPDERKRGLTTVADRFNRKLSSGTPPDAFPTELPLAPSIAPGLVALHDRVAAIVDNLDMMIDVIDEVLVHPGVRDRLAAVNDVVTQFVSAQYRCVPADEWIVVALRHSIFEQGGPALGTMAGNERNAFYGGHGQHFAARRAPSPCDPE